MRDYLWELRSIYTRFEPIGGLLYRAVRPNAIEIAGGRAVN